MRKKILITGGAGFIGSHLAQELATSGYDVRILDNFSPQVHGDTKCLPEAITSDVELIEGDVRSERDLARALDGVDVVYHFAASVGVGQSMYEIHSYVDNNNRGTAVLMQLLTRRPIQKLIVASSMSIYGEGLYEARDGSMRAELRRDLARLKGHEWEPADWDGSELRPVATPENKKPDLASIYALTKYDQERMCMIAGEAYGIPTVGLRFFNVYGRGQALSNPYTGVMAIFASRLLNDQPPMIFEDGNQMRDFVHVSDVAKACRLALESSAGDGMVFNVGSGNRYTVREIAQQMAKVLGKEHIQPEITQRYRVGDIRHCFADISLARNVLGFQPSVTLGDGMTDLAGWLTHQTAVDRTDRARDELISRGLAI